jgi:hypothetical protein
VIVGAGASGVAAASQLLENKMDDFVILEAENRYGGRIDSVRFGMLPYIVICIMYIFSLRSIVIISSHLHLCLIRGLSQLGVIKTKLNSMV